MIINLLRHGRTQGNLEHRYVGTTDQPLCPEGRAALEGRSVPPVERLFVSPMRRCRETAAILYPHMPQEIIPDLHECCFGDFEGCTYEELKDDPAYRAWLDGRADPPGGESKQAQQQRSVRAFRRLTEPFGPEAAIALVVHGGTIMCLLEALEESYRFYDWQAKNGGGFCCTWDGERASEIAAMTE